MATDTKKFSDLMAEILPLANAMLKEAATSPVDGVEFVDPFADMETEFTVLDAKTGNKADLLDLVMTPDKEAVLLAKFEKAKDSKDNYAEIMEWVVGIAQIAKKVALA